MPPRKHKQTSTSQRAGRYGNGGEAGINNINSSANINNKNSSAKKGSQPQSASRDNAARQQPKPALKAEGNYIINKEKLPQGKKAHIDPDAYEYE